ncbi:hypothetical protein E2C01_071989 [Portunus trituberculatus]|uniref:Uncharacterized protein n=1 Tax=Portunus trituberculatus TaxID=210409 RepID=A0A5B7I5C4_PORTR|nr:hypothetical protein [Portunus trituberculatus]
MPGRWTTAFRHIGGGCEPSSLLPVFGGRGSGSIALSDTVGPRGTAVTVSSDVSMLRPSSSQEARSDTEGVREGWTETTGATIAGGPWRTYGHVHREKP